MSQAYQVPRAIQAGRVWVNCYHAYPAHAPFGGYKQSGFGREVHRRRRRRAAAASCSASDTTVTTPTTPNTSTTSASILPQTHKMMLNHYRQTKNMLISLDKNKLGFF